MDERKLEIIQQLMEELQGLMQPGADELGERLGKPKMEVEIEAAPMGEDMECDMPEEMAAPEDKLKKRIMQMRG